MRQPIQFKLNLPEDVKLWIAERAKANVRSQGSEVVAIIRAAMAQAEANP